MKPLVSPYGIRFQEDGCLETFPAVEIFIKGRGDKGIRAVFLIDSGATTTVIPCDDAYLLGLNIKDGAPTTVKGLGNTTFFGRRFLLNLKMGDATIDASVTMIDNPDTPHILGREDIFNHFGILFDEAKHRTSFLDSRKQRKVIDSLF